MGAFSQLRFPLLRGLVCHVDIELASIPKEELKEIEKYRLFHLSSLSLPGVKKITNLFSRTKRLACFPLGKCVHTLNGFLAMLAVTVGVPLFRTAHVCMLSAENLMGVPVKN